VRLLVFREALALKERLRARRVVAHEDSEGATRFLAVDAMDAIVAMSPHLVL